MWTCKISAQFTESISKTDNCPPLAAGLDAGLAFTDFLAGTAAGGSGEGAASPLSSAKRLEKSGKGSWRSVNRSLPPFSVVCASKRMQTMREFKCRLHARKGFGTRKQMKSD